MNDAEAKPRKRKKTIGRHGEGAIYLDKSRNRYAFSIDLPPVAWDANGKPVRRRKVLRFRTRPEAVAALREHLDQKRKMGTLSTRSLTVEAWFRKWLSVYVVPQKRPRTADTYRTYVEQYIVPALGPTTRLNKITTDSVRAIEGRIMAKGLSSTTARNAYHYAAAALDAAMREGHLYANPARSIVSPRKARVDLDVLSLEEAIELLRHLATRADGAMWATYLLTGARRGEVAGLEPERVGDFLDLSWQLQRLAYTHGCGGSCGRKRAGNCPERHLEIPADYEARQVQGGLYLTRPKSNAGWRVVPLVDPLRTILRRFEVPENEWGLMFPGVHKNYGYAIPPDPDRITHEWPKLREEVFGPGRNVRLHDVRHTTVDLLYLAGVPEDLVSEIVGHSNRAMTRAYKTKGNQPRLTAAMAQLSELFTRPETTRTPEIAS
ncbi:tyrosine-type recombinase/integrase [Microbacterium oxydans]|uniref:tyrosine-type recombinase/integrase n=1 Tax=Microbacterium oxydans TaxID=82380 RepID=UPI0037CBDC42